MTFMPYFPLASGVLTGQVQTAAPSTPRGSRLAALGEPWPGARVRVRPRAWTVVEALDE